MCQSKVKCIDYHKKIEYFNTMMRETLTTKFKLKEINKLIRMRVISRMGFNFAYLLYKCPSQALNYI